MITEESLLRVYMAPIVGLAAFVAPVVIAPSVITVVLLMAAAVVVTLYVRRRKRAGLYLMDDELYIVNRHRSHAVPVNEAILHVGRQARWAPQLRQKHLDYLGVIKSTFVYIAPKSDPANRVEVDAMHGLMPKEFRRVLADLEALLTVGYS